MRWLRTDYLVQKNTPVITAYYIILLCSWIGGLVLTFMAFRKSRRQRIRWFASSLISSLASIAIGYLGSTNFYVESTTSSGYVKHFDSRWLFEASLVPGILSLIYLLWKKTRSVTPG